ncbi:16S/23S rRNA (cytidine-2'-O)-methyltransferase TlyA [Phycisphaerales bacterium]|nr:16S/23S rRNA (cytidine-2'-O)-methyltransferase TlyA [Phycisphaerales bacterium]
MTKHGYVSRGGLKLRHALDEFRIDPAGLTCADLGASTGGFTDCLLQAGAARVFAVDTAYGEFAWKLRNDPRVTLMERTNALHAAPVERVDLVVLDLGWTPQRLAIPEAMRWLKPDGRVITLIKPHYEHKVRGGELPRGGVLEEALAAEIARQVTTDLPALGVRVLGITKSPIAGGAKARGNAEWLALLARP